MNVYDGLIIYNNKLAVNYPSTDWLIILKIQTS